MKTLIAAGPRVCDSLENGHPVDSRFRYRQGLLGRFQGSVNGCLLMRYPLNR